MSHGTPDWSMTRRTDIFSLVDDLAELPPRLGHPSSIDRRGAVLLMETFDNGGGMVLVDTEVSGDEAVLCPDYARYGRFAYRLTRAADAEAGVEIKTGIAAVVTDKIGYEVHFFSSSGSPDIVMWLRWRDGTTEYLWGLRWDTANSKVYIRHSDHTWVEVVGTFTYTVGNGLTHIMKLVADSADYSYSRVFIDGTSVTLPTAGVTERVLVFSPHVLVQFLNDGTSTSGSILHVDALIITRGEE